MSTTGHRLFRTSLLPAFLFCAATLPGQATELQLAAVNTNGRPLLHVVGSAGTKYSVEQSLNLSDWFSIYTGVATNGALEYLDSPFHGRSAFYRARPASAPLIVQPVVDTNRVGVGMIRTNGGSCEVMAANGTRFKLTVPSNTVPDGVMITMTVVTNLGGVPGEGLFPAAVQLEPDGLEFMGAALLEIEFPTNISTSQMASFAFGSSGTGVYLTPDQVETNRVLIPVTHFSSAGTSQFTKQQLAVFTGLSIENALDQASHTVASQLDQARQNGTLDGETAQNALTAAASQFAEDNILPHLEEAKKNCALFRKMMPLIFGLNRQAQLLGASVPELDAAAEGLWCPGLLNCEQEVLDKCEQQGGSLDSLSELLTIERTRQIGPYDCPTSGDPMARMTNCAPLWWGTFTYIEAGSTNDTSIPDCVQDWNFALYLNGVVTNATEMDMFFMKAVTLYLAPDAEGQFSVETTCNEKGTCNPSGSWWHYGHSLQKWVTGAKQPATITWYIYPDGTVQNFEILFAGDAPATGTMESDSRGTDCDGYSSSSNENHVFVGGLGAYSYVAGPTDPTGVTANAANGSHSQSFIDRGVATRATWTWDFHRKQ